MSDERCDNPPCEHAGPFRYCPIEGCGWMEAPTDEEAVSVAESGTAAIEACIQETLDVIEQYGQIDGDRHKAWVIDQVLRALTDNDYAAWVTAYTQDGEYAWDEGTAP